MPLAIATALQFSLHKDTNSPTMYVTPEVVTTEASAFLVYTAAEGGHYDAAVPCHKISTHRHVMTQNPTAADVVQARQM